MQCAPSTWWRACVPPKTQINRSAPGAVAYPRVLNWKFWANLRFWACVPMLPSYGPRPRKRSMSSAQVPNLQAPLGQICLDKSRG